MNGSKAAEPRFHDTVTIPLAGRAEGMRVIVTAAGILWILVSLFLVPRHRLKSLAWQKKVCRAVGLLYDYSQAMPTPSEVLSQSQYLSNFVGALTAGTVVADGSDPTGLFWRPMGWAGVAEILSYVNLFADYCANKLETTNLNPRVPATFAERIAAFRRLDIRNQHSLLKHLGNAKARYTEARQSREVVARRAPKAAAVRPPYFPRRSFQALLNVGFRRQKVGRVWEQYNLRDTMIALLQRHGGLRASEPFHLFVTDVFEDPRCPGHAEVRLYHPELGRFSYRDSLSGKVVHVTRREFLMARYGRVPRNLMSGKQHAGWKDLMLDYDKPEYYCVVRWFPLCCGKFFWDIYKIYVRNIIPPGLDHPYLFVNSSGASNYGSPYQLDTYYKNLDIATRRIGLETKKNLGTTSHGLRHAYGQDLEDHKIDEKIIQLCLHHKSPLSQRVYTQPELEKARRELNAGWQRMSHYDTPPPLDGSWPSAIH